MYLPLTQRIVRAEPLQPHASREGDISVDILAVGSNFCPVGSSAVRSLHKIVPDFGDEVRLWEVPADSGTVERSGVVDGIFVNGKTPFTGTVREEALRQAIRDELAIEKNNPIARRWINS